jgi:D-alanyl-D-alanine dipeptidase
MTSCFKPFALLCTFLCIVSCKSQTIVSDAKENNSSIINDTTFVNLKDYSLDFVYDMKYATTDNF